MENLITWKIPTLVDFELSSTGDMPEDIIQINENLFNKAKTILEKLIKNKIFLDFYNRDKKIVISIFGGSGSGKSTVASILASLFNINYIEAYVLSGDNYPNRVPVVNDNERIRIYRDAGLKGLVLRNDYNMERHNLIKEMQKINVDSNNNLIKKHPWIESYIYSGKEALRGYLGTEKEIDFMEVSQKLNKFKNNENNIFLKRMGKDENSIWYEEVDFSNTKILILEWTHGGSEYLKGIDFSVMLDSTPTETLEYRKKRARDAGVESFFTKMVLDIEQNLLVQQGKKADIIV